MRLIDGDALKNKIEQHSYPLSDRINSIENGMFLCGIYQAIDESPTIDAAPVVHGRWILLGKNEHDYETSVEEKCSLCGRYVYRYDTELQDNYCPNCGARMDAT